MAYGEYPPAEIIAPRWPKPESKPSLLQEADEIINGARQKDYGPPSQSFGLIAKHWSAYLETEVTPLDVANLMILLKVCRAKTGGFHRDSYKDIAGYSGCVELLKVTDEQPDTV